jgi:hypothetical protein
MLADCECIWQFSPAHTYGMESAAVKANSHQVAVIILGMQFPKKHFQGVEYDLSHLRPVWLPVPLNVAGTIDISMHVSYSCHCFSEEFDHAIHQEHHRYAFAGEVRAFNVMRYDCSTQLPAVVNALLKGKVYRASNDNYTYVAHITLENLIHPYSVFFHLKKDAQSSNVAPKLRMHIQSAYISPLKVSTGAQSWRFRSLAGRVAGVFEPPKSKTKPKKKKTP